MEGASANGQRILKRNFKNLGCGLAFFWTTVGDEEARFRRGGATGLGAAFTSVSCELRSGRNVGRSALNQEKVPSRDIDRPGCVGWA